MEFVGAQTRLAVSTAHLPPVLRALSLGGGDLAVKAARFSSLTRMRYSTFKVRDQTCKRQQ